MKWITVALTMVLACCVHARAGHEGLGVGVIVGEPTGISLKTWLNDSQAIDAAAAWSFSGDDAFQFHADFLVHNFDLLQGTEVHEDLAFYYGVGGRVKLKGEKDGRGKDGDDVRMSVRFPLGISYLFEHAPFDFFLEVVPMLNIVPDTDFGINAAIGARFYFR
jgi:hypothetical protein